MVSIGKPTSARNRYISQFHRYGKKLNCVSPILCGGKPSKSINQKALSRYEKYRKNGEHAAEPLSITRSIYSKLKHTHTSKHQKAGDHVKRKKKTGTKYWSKYLQRPKK